MNKVAQPQLPDFQDRDLRALNEKLKRVFLEIINSVNQGADGYLHQTSAVSTNHTASLNDSILLVDSTGGSRTVTLPSATLCKDKRYVVKKADASANVVIVDPSGSELIDNVTAYTITGTYASIDAVSDGTKWWVV